MENRLLTTVKRLFSGYVLAFHDIPPDRLVELVEALPPAEPVSLSELVERSKRGKPTSGLFAITVDDGVGATVRALSRLFAEKKWPATFYVPTQYLDTGRGMMFQLWRSLVPFLPQAKLELHSGICDLSHPGAVERLSKKMQQLWYTRRLETYAQITTELLEAVSRQGGAQAVQPPAPITWSEVESLSRNELLQFESHGVSHIAMSALTDEEVVFEMKHSRDVVAEHTGRPCRHLAYPFGGPESIGQRVPLLARHFYDSATTMSLGHVDGANPWLLPRIPLYPENSALRARLKVLLKCHEMKFFPVRAA